MKQFICVIIDLRADADKIAVELLSKLNDGWTIESAVAAPVSVTSSSFATRDSKVVYILSKVVA